MGLESIVAIGGLVSGLIVSLVGLFKKGKQVKTLSEKLGVVSEGLNRIGDAVEKLKTSPVANTPAGKQVTAALKEYGPAVTAVVDEARKVAAEVESGE